MLPQAVTAEVKNDVCAGCHDEVSEMFHNTVHGTVISGDATCESCHGSAVKHIDSGDPADIMNPANASQFGSDLLCLTCHKDHQFDDWKFSAHNNNDVTCASCHKVHVSAEKSSKKYTRESCYTCHTNIKAQMMMPSHHPVEEGKVDCVDCHAVHGGSVALTMDDSGKELCFSCHAEKEGPFVYEHAPVTEDCMICHSPHGTVANNLLKKAEPTICLSCHPMHFHATVVSQTGDIVVPQNTDRNFSVTSDEAWKEGMLTNCTRCHTEIHGSDHSSQATSTGGNALTR